MTEGIKGVKIGPKQRDIYTLWTVPIIRRPIKEISIED